MKYNIFTHGMFTHYVPKQSRMSKVTAIVFMTALVIVVAGMLAYSIVMFGTN